MNELTKLIDRLEKAAIHPVDARRIQELIIDLRAWVRDNDGAGGFDIVSFQPQRPSPFPM